MACSADPAGVPEAVVGHATLGVGGEVRLHAIEEIHIDRVHMLDLNPTARLGLEQCGDLVERAPGDVDAGAFSRGAKMKPRSPKTPGLTDLFDGDITFRYRRQTS